MSARLYVGTDVALQKQVRPVMAIYHFSAKIISRAN
ncbi:hypothetical protein C8J45_11634, partial [Sphingomonas sp. PP-CE-3G-477]